MRSEMTCKTSVHSKESGEAEREAPESINNPRLHKGRSRCRELEDVRMITMQLVKVNTKLYITAVRAGMIMHSEVGQ